MPLRNRSELLHAIVSSAAGGTLAISGAGAVAGQRVSIYRLILSAGAAVNVTVQDTASAALSAPFQFIGTSLLPVVVDGQMNGDPLWQSGTGLGVQLNASGAVQVNADVWFLVSS